MKKNKKIGFICVCCCAAVVAATIGGIGLRSSSLTAEAGIAEIVAGQIEETYSYGASFTLPSSVQIEYEGEEYAASKGYVIFPDGVAYSSEYAYSLNALGAYKVVYETTVNGKTVSAEQSFYVNAGNYSIGADSTLTYDTLRAFSQYENLTEEEKAAGLRMGALKTEVKGLKISFSSGDTFTYNKPINIYENTYNDILQFNSLQFDPLVKSWTIRLTDCYDPSIYIEVSFNKVAKDEVYLRMNAYGMATVGLRQSSSNTGDVYIDGKAYNKNNNGTPMKSNRSMDYVTTLKQDRYNNATFVLDTTSKTAIKAYVKNVSPYGDEPAEYLIGQLDNAQVFPYRFDGFTNGDVYLSLTAKDFNGVQYGDFEIASIMGVSGEELKPADYRDTTPPEITIDAPQGDIDIIAGAPISVPSATAIDVSGLVSDVDYAVWYGYDTENKRMLQIQGGCFTPNSLGKYTIEYYVSDIYGNKAVKRLDMLAVKEGTEGIEFVCEKVNNIAAGDYVQFGNYSAVSLMGEANVSVRLTLPNGTVKELVEPSAPILLESTGTYTVTYTYQDSFYEGTYSYQFNAADENKYAFAGSVIAPKYFIKGASYTLDEALVYRYSSETPQMAAVKAYVSYDGGSYTEFDCKNFTVTGKKKAVVKFVCVENESVYIESEEISIVDVGYNTENFDKSKYFVGSFNGSVSEEQSDRTTYTYKFTSTAKPELDFINTLSLASFGLKFSLPEGQKTKSVSLVLTDYYDRTKQASLTISQDDGGTYFSYNGGTAVKLAGKLIGSPVDVAYDGVGTLRIGNDKFDCPISFTSDLCLLTVKFTGLTHNNKFEVYSVCNQAYGYYVTSDVAKPILSAEEPERVAKIGDIITIAKPTFVDVLSPNTAENCTVTVYKNGALVHSTEGVQLKSVSDFESEYKFKIDGYGSYLIIYEYRDGCGKKSDLRYTITVTDNQAPSISLNDYNGSPIEMQIGKETSVIAYTASDNFTALEDLEIWLFVYNERGVCVSSKQNVFTVKDAGKYTVYVYCIDEAGNTAFTTYEVIAK